MIPRLVMAVWLTVMALYVARKLNEIDDEAITSIIGSTINIAIPIIALYYAGFWVN